MNKLFAALVATAMIAVAAPANAATMDKNVDFFLDSLGLDAIPEGTATVYMGTDSFEMSIADAIHAAAARAGDVDLGAVAAAAGPTDSPSAGDVWVIEIGFSRCNAPTIYSASPVPNTAFHPQAYTYAGAIGEQDSPGGSGIILDWTTKFMTGTGYSGSSHIVGQSDFFCLYFFGFSIYFPFLDGVAYLN